MRSPFFAARDEDGDSIEIEDSDLEGSVIVSLFTDGDYCRGQVYLSTADEEALLDILTIRKNNRAMGVR